MDKDTFSKLVVDSTDSLYRVSKSILKNDTDCKDAVSEAITIAFQKLHTLKNDKYAKTWLTRILINECYRQKKYNNRIISDEESVMDYLNHSAVKYYHDSENYYDLYEAMSCLNDEQRLTITLFYYEGYSIKEISKITKTAQGTVKSRLSIARQHLKQYLKEEYHYDKPRKTVG